MKRLSLLRHAKSSWKDTKLDDHDRPLNARGRAAAEAIGRVLSEPGLRPDIVLCSTAARARETLDHLFELPPPTRVQAGLYLAPPERILEYIHGLDDKLGSALVIGHNPGLATLACALAIGAETRGPARFSGKFPTAALAVFDLDISRWSDVAPGCAVAAALTRPRDLK